MRQSTLLINDDSIDAAAVQDLAPLALGTEDRFVVVPNRERKRVAAAIDEFAHVRVRKRQTAPGKVLAIKIVRTWNGFERSYCANRKITASKLGRRRQRERR